jgi:hypothetical protein
MIRLFKSNKMNWISKLNLFLIGSTLCYLPYANTTYDSLLSVNSNLTSLIRDLSVNNLLKIHQIEDSNINFKNDLKNLNMKLDWAWKILSIIGISIIGIFATVWSYSRKQWQKEYDRLKTKFDDMQNEYQKEIQTVVDNRDIMVLSFGKIGQTILQQKKEITWEPIMFYQICRLLLSNPHQVNGALLTLKQQKVDEEIILEPLIIAQKEWKIRVNKSSNENDINQAREILALITDALNQYKENKNRHVVDFT